MSLDILFKKTLTIKNLKTLFSLKCIKHLQNKSKTTIYKSGNWQVYEVYIVETILNVRQADYILPKLGSSHNYLTRLRNQLVAPKIII